MHTVIFAPLLAALSSLPPPVSSAPGIAAADHSAPSGAPVERASMVGSWEIRADQGGCERKVEVSADGIVRIDGKVAGTWMLTGDVVHVAVQANEIPAGHLGRAKVGVRWSGGLEVGDPHRLSGKLTVEILDASGKTLRKKKLDFVATRA